MDVQVIYPQKPPQSSPCQSLNPDAPIFVPMKSYQTVEDFSDQWWDLVHSSPFFRDYWLQDCFEDVDDHDDHIFDDDFFHSDDLFLPDFDAFSEIFLQQQEEKVKEEEKKKKEEEEEKAKELITMAALKWNGCNGRTKEACRNFEKAPKVVKNVKVSPRTIHQPR